MSPRELPARPNLEHLKNQARILLREAQAADPAAIARFSEAGITAEPKLADALHVTAREYGFDTWPKLKAHVEAGSEDPNAALAAAIKANDAGLARAVLERHRTLQARINEPLPGLSFDMPAIVAAAHHDNKDLVDALLDAGANINGRSRWWAGGFGVLDLCSAELAEYLISRGAKLDICAAARLGKTEAVKEMLAADPHLAQARGGDGQTPLHFAATQEIAEMLLQHGAEIDARDIDHESTAAQYMACFGRCENSPKDERHGIVRFLLERGAEPDILMASAVGDRALVERLLNDDPDGTKLTASDKYFPKRNPHAGGCIYIYGFGITKTPHMIALQFGHQDVFDLLMQRSSPWLRLTQAAETGDEGLVRAVVQKHPAIFTRLPEAASRRIIGTAIRNNARAVELLLQHGWPPNATLENQQTALHYAAWHGNLAMVQALLRHGAPPNVFEMEHGGNALAWALHGSENSWHRETGDYPGVARALLRGGTTIPKPKGPLQATEEVLSVLAEFGA